MAAFTHKRTVTETMKITGIIDTDRMVVDVDGEEKKLTTLLSVFNGGGIELNVKIKDEEELPEPTADETESDDM